MTFCISRFSLNNSKLNITSPSFAFWLPCFVVFVQTTLQDPSSFSFSSSLFLAHVSRQSQVDKRAVYTRQAGHAHCSSATKKCVETHCEATARDFPLSEWGVWRLRLCLALPCHSQHKRTRVSLWSLSRCCRSPRAKTRVVQNQIMWILQVSILSSSWLWRCSSVGFACVALHYPSSVSTRKKKLGKSTFWKCEY